MLTKTALVAPSLMLISSVFVLAQAPQPAGELASKLEMRVELANEYQVLEVTLQDNQREKLVVQSFCNTTLQEPIRSVRIDYCIKKYKFFDDRASDIKAQAAKLQGTIQRLDQEIQELRNKGPKK